MAFLLKKFFANLLFPLPVAVWCLLAGTILLLATRRQTAGKVFILLGTLMVIAFSNRDISDALLKPLEAKYPPARLSSDHSRDEEFRHLAWVVVLGGGHTSDARTPLSSQLSPPSLVRLAEGIRIHRMLPGSRLLLSGGGAYDTSSDANVMKNVAMGLGLDPSEMVLETESKDTDDQARLLQPILGGERFVLVTSAAHMRRSVDLFVKLGMRPIPAPTDFMANESPGLSPGKIFPTPEALAKAERAVYEYLGEWWAAMRGKV
jgi:uncharacterized SAM-binding protein YcdF (DUF218 family)